MFENPNEFTWNISSNIEFISNISHELRTPLNNILGAQKLLTLNVRKDSYTLKSQNDFIKYLGSIRNNSYRLQRIINNFIDITDIQLGLSKLNLVNDNIISIIKKIVKNVAFVALGKGIDLFFCTNVDQKIIAFDKEKTERILLNLLSNAIKYSERGKTIEVVAIAKEESILILVKDQGIGIPKQKLESIFEPFMQVDKSFIRSQEGSGIGLAIVKSFVELQKGHISVTSKEEEGSIFEIELPADICSESITKIFDDEEANIMQKIKIEFSDISEVSDDDDVYTFQLAR